MTTTIYQVWRYNPLKEEWFHYNHIPYATTPEVVKQILIQHQNGEYKASQFKPWMKNYQFKIVRVDQTFTDWEVV
jgi:hypothetical protein